MLHFNISRVIIITIEYVICLFQCCEKAQVTSEEIFFELGDTEVNDYIISGERNVTMRCGFMYLPFGYRAEIKIKHKGVIVAENNGKGRSTSYTITGVTPNDGGDYSCTVVYGRLYYGCKSTCVRNQTLYVAKCNDAVALWYSASMVLLAVLGTLVV